MLNIYSLYNINKPEKLVTMPWDTYFIQNSVTSSLDESDTKILEKVEKTSLINSDTIQGKFMAQPIGIGLLSDGCKTLLCINHAIKNNKADNYIFNITSCGGNAVEYLATELAKNNDVNVIIEHGDLGYFRDTPVSVNGKILNSSVDVAKELTRAVV